MLFCIHVSYAEENITNSSINNTIEINETFNNETIENETINNSGLIIEVILEDEIYSNAEYKNLFKIKNIGHVAGEKYCINVTASYNITGNEYYKEDEFMLDCINAWKSSGTGEVLFENAGEYSICGKIIESTIADTNESDDIACKEITVIDSSSSECDLSISIDTEKEIFNNKDKVKFNTNLNTEEYPYEITYGIEDMFSKSVKNERVTTNTNQKSWTIKSDKAAEAFVIKAKVRAIGCNDNNEENDFAEKVIVVKNKRDDESSISIDNIYLGKDDKAAFGEVVKVLTTIYKGNTSKYSIKFFVEKNNRKISGITTVHFHEKYNEHTMTIPIQLKKNCNKQYSDGVYSIVIEGLDKRKEKKIRIEGSKGCGKEEKESRKGKINYELVSFNYTVEKGKEFFAVVKINNSDDEKHNFSVWSYVYRGGKSYSGYKLNNMKKISIEAYQEKNVILSNVINEGNAGVYKWKVQILKDDLKTPYEIIEEIAVIVDEPEQTATVQQEEVQECVPLASKEDFQETEINNASLNEITGNVIYMSKSQKIKSFIPYIMAGVFCLLSIALVFAKI